MEQQSFTQYVAEGILVLAITDDVFLRTIKPILEPEAMPSAITQKALGLVFNFYDKFNRAPGAYINEEINSAVERGYFSEDEADIIDPLLSRLLGEKEKPNRDYIISRLDEWLKIRTYLNCAVQLAREAQRGSIEEAQEILAKAVQAGVPILSGAREFLSDDAVSDRIYRREEGFEFLMPWGIVPFDKRMPGPRRGHLLVVMGPEKQGKTWGLIFLGTVALMRGLNVLAISCGDLYQGELEDRFDMAICGVAAAWKRTDEAGKFQKEIQYWVGDELRKERIEEVELGTIADPKIVKLGTKAMSEWGGRLVTQWYAAGECSMGNVEALLESLALQGTQENPQPFIADVVLLDYIEIMRLNPRLEMRLRVDEAYVEFRGMAGRRGFLAATASQVTKDAYKKKKLTLADFPETKTKAAHCDFALGICMTEAEEEEGRARLVMVVDRHYGRMGSMCEVRQDRQLGQFAVQARSLPRLESIDEEED